MGKSLSFRETILIFSLGLIALLVAVALSPSPIATSVEVGITASSPLGSAGGVVVPASCSSYEHTVGECDTNPIGYHDSLSCTVTNGWACDASSYPTALQIDFYKDGPAGAGGTYAWSTTANISREAAVGTACGGGTSSHGFQSNIPSSLKDGATHSIYAYAINIGTAGARNVLLTSSPKSISCAAVTPPSFTVNGVASATITSGSSATLQWSCSNSTSSSGGGFSTGGATSGSVSVTPAVGTTQYTVQCSNGGQSTVSVTVLSAVMNISANPALVRSGGTSVISWSASNVNSCAVTGSGISASGLSGSATTPAITAETTYTLTCQVTGLGAVSRSVIVKLVPKFEEF